MVRNEYYPIDLLNMIFDDNIIRRLLATPEYASRSTQVSSSYCVTVAHQQNPFQAAWLELHTQSQPTREWFAEWQQRLPRIGCDCDTWLIEYLISNPPHFDARWPAWTWHLHNAVNTKLDYPKMTWADYVACWHNQAPCKNPRLVITLASGTQCRKMLDLTRPSMEAYATRCNADFLALTNTRFDQWQREKFRIYEFAQQYDETIFLDADCVVRPGVDNLFEICQGYDVGMHNDWGKLAWQWDWPAEYLPVLQSQGLDGLAEVQQAKQASVVWNSGVVYCTRESAEIWRPPTNRLPDSHCSEQFWVHFQASKFRIKSLEAKLNWQYWFRDFAEGIDQAQIVHLANHPDKLSGVAKYLALD